MKRSIVFAHLAATALLIVFVSCNGKNNATTACEPCDTVAESSRARLAEIRVGRDGNFRYWSDESEALKRLKAFVAEVTDEKSAGYVPPCDRIATFDMDGTLICETAPTYINFMAYCKRVLHDDSYSPTPDERDFVQEVEAYIRQNHTLNNDWGMRTMDGQAKAYQGMTQQEFFDWFTEFLETEPAEGFIGLKWGEAVYWPMIEVVSYLVANDFKVYVCSGSDRDLTRAVCNGVFEIQPYQVIASDVSYIPESQYLAGDKSVLDIAEGVPFSPGEKFVRGNSGFLNTSINKISSIIREIGRKPILSWGNSSGDFPMLSFTTTGNEYPSIAFCNLCDDTEREFGNVEKAARTKAKCDDYGWVSVSMRDDWKTIYGPDVKKE